MDIWEKAKTLVTSSTVHGKNGNDIYGTDWVLTVIDEEGYPCSTMLTASKADGFDTVYFCTGSNYRKTRRLLKDKRACIYLFNESLFAAVSLVGDAAVVTEPDIKKQVWFDELKDSFSGPDDNNWCVIAFKPIRYNFFIDGQNVYGDFNKKHNCV